MKKKFGNFLKQLGDSLKKKRNISANVRHIRSFSVAIAEEKFGRRNFVNLEYIIAQNF